ncbi:PHB depolymerase family esterase [Pseudolysobacter antarcticus]|uniref:PHB depolymerase family esterase n=1 Tax=Pseudolysobacter antarcticus TaxID=2511995 RepID=A0A411HIC0_9GAMM|nr:PHB depolymerase family esterase [Pseudolysobacter antarcticus]QBB70164.1 PHB depolymerase family esterase [Pseudolysobacter antarcticus]
MKSYASFRKRFRAALSILGKSAKSARATSKIVKEAMSRLPGAASKKPTKFDPRRFSRGAAYVTASANDSRDVQNDARQATSGRACDRDVPAEHTSRFLAGSYTCDSGTREYKLYVPECYRAGVKLALVVMLHGCTQSPDDFAAGTRMNELAEEQGFLVLYPAQTASANGAKCWKWFKPEDQQRDRGEASILAGMTREVSAQYGVDERRVFVAGLSAGAAMAVILGETYPDLFAAVGAHSGLPYAAAHDALSAFRVMKSGRNSAKSRGVRVARATKPTIVFHGDRDQTVDMKNGAQIVRDAVVKDPNAPPMDVACSDGESEGRSFLRTVYGDPSGRHRVEHWIIRGAGHAWSGGSERGSYTDARGPNASTEMIRFFYSAVH